MKQCRLLTGVSILLALALVVLAAGAPAITPVPKNSHEWRQKHETYVKAAKRGGINVLFIGDSITEYWSTAGKEVWDKRYAPMKAAQFGIAADRVEHILWRMRNGELEGRLRPKVVVLLAGINNSWGTPRAEREKRGQFIANGITEIVKTIREKQPAAKILVLGIFPLGDGTAPCVRVANAAIAKLDDGKKVRFLDIGSQLAGENGNVPADVMPDGTHPSAKGYSIWADAIDPLLRKMMKP